MAQFSLKSFARAVSMFIALGWIQFHGVIGQETGCVGTLDRTFAPNQGQFTAMAVDGSQVIGASPGRLVRIREDGSTDIDFTVALSSSDETAPQGVVFALAKDSQGRWLAGGAFTAANNTSRNGIVRLLPDGTVDPTFAAFTGPNAQRTTIHAIVLNGDALMVAGHNGTKTDSNFVVRLDSNGAIDPSFNAGPASGGMINTLALQADGKILAGGKFTNFAGTARNQLCRLLSNGALDDSFKPEPLMPLVSGIKALADQKMLIYFGGDLPPANGEPAPTGPRNSLVRLNANGSVDQILSGDVNTISDVTVQSDGKYLLAGRFVHNREIEPNICFRRIFPNGSPDLSFVSNVSAYQYPYFPDRISIDSQGRFVIAGPFVKVNAIIQIGLARLLGDSSPCVPKFSFETNNYEFIEADGVITIPIIRSGDLAAAASVQITAPDPYKRSFPLSTNFVFAPGVTRQEIQIPLTNNLHLDEIRGFRVNLVNPSAPAVPGEITTASVWILDSSAAVLPGGPDPAFNVDLGKFDGVGSLVITPDRKIVVGGGFSEIAGLPSPPLARLNLDGSVDTSFNYAGANPILVAPSGDKLYVVTTNTPTPLSRLLANGSVDLTFTSPTFAMIPEAGPIQALGGDHEGNILVAGPFTSVNGTAANGVIKLKANGTVDSAFNAGAGFAGSSGRVNVIRPLPDGSFLVGGTFRSYDAQERPILAHLSTTGALLPDFQITGDLDTTAQVTGIAAQSNGSIVVGGQFTKPASNISPPLLRFTPAGAIDSTFASPSQYPSPFQIFVQSDDKIITPSNTGIYRFHKDGAPDAAFFTQWPVYAYNYTAALDGTNLYVRYLDVYPDGEIGSFEVSRIRRLSVGDYKGPGFFNFSAPVSVREDSVLVKVTVSRYDGHGEASVRLRTRDANAIAGKNYVAVDTVVTFADGENGDKEVDIPLIEDPAASEYLNFYVALAPVTPGVLINEFSNERLVNITDNEQGFSIYGDPSAIEGQPTGWLMIYRRGNISEPASIEVVTEGGDAIPGVDYEPVHTTVQFEGVPYTSQMVYVQIPLIDDNITEPAKTIGARLQNPTGTAPIVLDQATATVTLNDGLDYFAFTSPAFDAVQNQQFATVLLLPTYTYASSPPSKTVTFSYKTGGGTAQPGIEYVPQEGQITFARGSGAAQEIRIPLLPNSIVGAPTTFNVTMTSLSPEVVLTNPVAQVILHHPAAVMPPGMIDERFPEIQESPNYEFRSLTETRDFIYVGEGSWQGSSRVIRYRKDGTMDQSFLLDVPYGSVELTLLPDESVLVNGSIVRITPSGAIDPSFQPRLPQFSQIPFVAPEPDGKLTIAGYSTEWFIRRLNADGSVDSSFNGTKIDKGAITDLKRQADGRILVSGTFQAINGVPRKTLARLLSNGQVDPNFFPPDDIVAEVHHLAPLGDGRFYASGWFKRNKVVPPPWDFRSDADNIARFNGDGTIDRSWAPQGFSDLILLVDEQDRLYLETYPYFEPQQKFVRFMPDGSVDGDFVSPIAGYPVSLVPGAALMGLQRPDYRRIIKRIVTEAPTALRAPQFLSNDHVALAFNFPASLPFILEQTEDFITWSEVKSDTSTNAYINVEIPTPSTNRFYRLRSK